MYCDLVLIRIDRPRHRVPNPPQGHVAGVNATEFTCEADFLVTRRNVHETNGQVFSGRDKCCALLQKDILWRWIVQYITATLILHVLVFDGQSPIIQNPDSNSPD